MTNPRHPAEPIPHIRDVIDVRTEGGHRVVHLAEGYDVFGNVHGGHLLAMAAAAILDHSAAPDIFSITGHFVRRAEIDAEVGFDVVEAGSSRRFTSVHATGMQGDRTIITLTALLGDRSAQDGPTWSDRPRWTPTDDDLGPPANTGEPSFDPPTVAKAYGMRTAHDDTPFAEGRRTDQARIRSWLPTTEPDVLDALLACDITPPVGWNALGFTGWVPTVELNAHVRAVPVPGPLTVVAESHHASAGFIEEDAEVFDADGRLVVQSRQLALWQPFS